MKNLEITRIAALKAYNNADANGKKMLVDLFGESIFNQKVTDCVKTFADVLEVAGLTEETFNSMTEGMTPDEVAYKQVKLIAEVLNEGWKPDWNNSSQNKYYPWFNMKGGFSCNGFGNAYYDQRSLVGSRLCFKSAELAKYAGTQFLDTYKAFFTA